MQHYQISSNPNLARNANLVGPILGADRVGGQRLHAAEADSQVRELLGHAGLASLSTVLRECAILCSNAAQFLGPVDLDHLPEVKVRINQPPA